MSAMRLAELSSYLDEYLALATVPDEPNALNGLQLDAGRDVGTVASSVDAAAAVIDEASRRGAELLLVHHGLLWGGNRRLVGAHGRKLRHCFEKGLSVYAAHAPLDVHPEVGNNLLLVRALGLEPDGKFARRQGIDLGLTANCSLAADELCARVSAAVGMHRLLGRGPEVIHRLGIVSGGGGSCLAEAEASGLDALLTGEISHHVAVDAEERGIHVIAAGHYRTERFGVAALGEHLASKFGLRHFFIDHDSGL